MSFKRPRSAYEADLQTTESPFVAYGTPLPPLDSHARDDGSYVPVWKQEVTDERGRKRLHGAFTGGFSAGYFNTVGSKEGWTPSTFVSSRTNRRKDEQRTGRPEDYMDEEDLQEQEEAQKMQTNDLFSGLGTTEADSKRRGTMMDLFKAGGETMGVKLLRRMGWREGQGVGPKVRRKARFDGGEEEKEEHLFAPDDSRMISFTRKDDRKGLGFAGEAGLEDTGQQQTDGGEENEERDGSISAPTQANSSKPPAKARKGAFGTGVLNDTGSDDEDPYEVGPRISYNKTIGGDKKKAKTAKAKPTASSANPLLASKPIFTSKKSTSSGFRKCHDGRLPLDGFLLSSPLDGSVDDPERYPIPSVPEGWKSLKAQTSASNADSTFQSTADAAKASKLDAKARAALLGEAPLPGKSVFDFLKPSARDRIATASGRTNLPAALGEAPTPSSAKPRQSATQSNEVDFPTLETSVALAALSRGTAGWMPYADDPAKLARYRSFLELHAGVRMSGVDDPSANDRESVKRQQLLALRPADLNPGQWIHEMQEFVHAARVFRPVTGAMASRFQSSSTSPSSSGRAGDNAASGEGIQLLSRPAAKPKDPAEEAAQMGFFGPLTRRVLTFYPTRLVCKRFGVKVPDHVNGETEGRAAHGEEVGGAGDESGMRTGGADGGASMASSSAGAPAGLGFKSFASGGVEHAGREAMALGDEVPGAENTVTVAVSGPSSEPAVDSSRNEALEAKRAGEELFRAVFGDDSEEE